MARENKLTEGVFTGIVGSRDKISSYDQFITTMTAKNSPELSKWTKKYRDHINKNKVKFQNLAKLEEVIMQMRSKETILDNIKLSLVREYIYARALFYREDKGTKDIRIIVDKMEFWDDSLENLSNNPDFMAKAVDKLKKAMEKEIGENLKMVENIFE
jgi:hypothetical protein